MDTHFLLLCSVMRETDWFHVGRKVSAWRVCCLLLATGLEWWSYNPVLFSYLRFWLSLYHKAAADGDTGNVGVKTMQMNDSVDVLIRASLLLCH